MSDIGTGGIGQAAGEMMREMQKVQQDLQQAQESQQLDGGQGFQQHLQTHQTGQVNQTLPSQKVQATEKATNILQQAKLNANLPTARAVGASQRVQHTKLVKMFQGLVKGQDKMSKIMDMALSGKQMSPPELLAMQAGVYRFSQELELTSKVVEKATSGIKQTMNVQV